jgi:hypothetical protein
MEIEFAVGGASHGCILRARMNERTQLNNDGLARAYHRTYYHNVFI